MARTVMVAYKSEGAIPYAPVFGHATKVDWSSGSDGRKVFLNQSANFGYFNGVPTDGHLTINGGDLPGADVAATGHTTAHTIGAVKPTEPAILTFTTTGPVNFDDIAMDRGQAGRRDPARIAFVAAWNRVLTLSEQWAAQRWMTRELRRRGCRIGYMADRRRLICFIGDSQTLGGSANYPPLVLQRLARGAAYLNFGVGGRTASTMITRAPIDVLPYIQAAQSDGVDEVIVVIRAGTNDMQVDGKTGAEAAAIAQALCQLYQGYGCKVVFVSCLDRTTAGGGQPVAGFTANRNAFNAINIAAASTFCDAYADVAADPNIGIDGGPNNATYFATDALPAGDGTHPNIDGQDICAALVATAINGLA